MTTFVEDGVSWLSGQLQDTAGVTVSIKRGSSTTTGVTAVMDNANYEITGEQGTITRVRLRDWWIAQEDYKIAAVAVEPRTGDRIINSAGEEWEIAPILNTAKGDMDAFADWDGISWWLHTKRVKA